MACADVFLFPLFNMCFIYLNNLNDALICHYYEICSMYVYPTTRAPRASCV